MSSILFTAWEGGGNVAPVLGLAERMVKRGHKVTVLTEPCLEQEVTRTGANYRPFRQHFTREDRSLDLIQDAKASALAIPAIANILLKPALDVAHETRAAIADTGAELIAADCMMPGALFAAECLGLPRVALFHMPEYLPGTNRPPGGMGLLPARSALQHLRQRVVTALFYRIINQYRAPMNAVRTELGLSPYRCFTDIYHQVDLRLMQTSAAFDIPISPLPRNVRYVGPALEDPLWAEDKPLPFQRHPTHPLVVVSLSSTFQNQRALLQCIINAVRGKPVQCLVTLGPAMAKETFEHGDNVVLCAGIAHSQVFPHASAVITHAGHGTVMKALSFGVPMVCLPMGRDQNDNAALVQHHGAGLKLSRSASAKRIFQALQRVLTDEHFRDNALRLQIAVQEEARSSLAQESLEQLLARP